VASTTVASNGVKPAGAALAIVLREFRAESGRTLLELAEESPVLLIFLRHFGCSFCREALDRISQVRGRLEAKGVRPVFVHLGTPERAKPYFDYYNLSDVERVSNPDASLYQHPVFALGRTNPFSHFFLSLPHHRRPAGLCGADWLRAGSPMEPNGGPKSEALTWLDPLN